MSDHEQSSDYTEQILQEVQMENEKRHMQLLEKIKLAKLAAPPDKEPFSVERFKDEYRNINQRNWEGDPGFQIKLEESYYLSHPELKSVAELADVINNADLHETG